MTNNSQIVKWAVISLVLLLLIPLVGMLGMMLVAGMTGSGAMSQMGSMMTGGMGAGAMGFCILWRRLCSPIVMLTRHTGYTRTSPQ